MFYYVLCYYLKERLKKLINFVRYTLTRLKIFIVVNTAGYRGVLRAYTLMRYSLY